MVTQPLRLRLPDREVVLEPDKVIKLELDETFGLRLLARAKDRVRLLKVGSRVAWESPLFGRVVGEVAMLPEGASLVVQHPIAEDLRSIPLDWIIEILPENADEKLVTRERYTHDE
jgi:hypothetical protein